MTAETLDPVREQIHEATVAVIGTVGFEAADMAEIARRAGIGEAELTERYPDKQACFLAAQEEMGREVLDLTSRALASGEGDWRAGLRCAAYAVTDFFLEDPARARFGALEPLHAGERAAAVAAVHLDKLVELVHAGRFELEDPDSVPRSAAEAAVGSIWQTLVRNIEDGRLRGEDLVPHLMSVAVLPYLGSEAAKEELTMPRPETASLSEPVPSPGRPGSGKGPGPAWDGSLPRPRRCAYLNGSRADGYRPWVREKGNGMRDSGTDRAAWPGPRALGLTCVVMLAACLLLAATAPAATVVSRPYLGSFDGTATPSGPFVFLGDIDADRSKESFYVTNLLTPFSDHNGVVVRFASDGIAQDFPATLGPELDSWPGGQLPSMRSRWTTQGLRPQATSTSSALRTCLSLASMPLTGTAPSSSERTAPRSRATSPAPLRLPSGPGAPSTSPAPTGIPSSASRSPHQACTFSTSSR